MSAELVMAGAGQPVTHEPIHDLESFFYVLVGICVLLDGPYKPKCDKDLAHCFDKYFNTFEPSILKTITMQSDLTWKPFILQHISTYFEPIIDLLTRLRDAIIVPLSTDDHGNVRRSQSFTHDMFIANIIQTLSYLNADAWISVDQANSHNSDSNLNVQVEESARVANEESPPAVTVTNEESPPAVTVTNEESPPPVTENQLYAESIVPVMASALPPLLPRPTFHRSFAGPGFYSVDTALAICHPGNEVEEEEYRDFPQKRKRSDTRSTYRTSGSSAHGTSNYILRNRRGKSTGAIPGLSVGSNTKRK